MQEKVMFLDRLGLKHSIWDSSSISLTTVYVKMVSSLIIQIVLSIHFIMIEFCIYTYIVKY